MHSDYIIRVIQQFMQAILSIVTARKAGNEEEAFLQIQNASQRFLQTDIGTILNMTPEDLLEHFKGGTKYLDTDQCIICADLIYEMALICESTHSDNAATRSKISCLYLYLNAIPKDKQFQTQNYIDRVQSLIKDLDTKAISDSVKERIVDFQKWNSKST